MMLAIISVVSVHVMLSGMPKPNTTGTVCMGMHLSNSLFYFFMYIDCYTMSCIRHNSLDSGIFCVKISFIKFNIFL